MAPAFCLLLSCPPSPVLLPGTKTIRVLRLGKTFGRRSCGFAMQLFCPTCQAPFAGASRCPRCGGLLLMPHEVAPDAAHRPADDAPTPARPTAVGRVVVGTVLAMGLYLAVRKLVTGAVLATEPDPGGWWLSVKGLSAVYALQTLAVVFGAVVAAAGRASGYPLGAAVGVACGGLLLGHELLGGAPPRDLVLYMQLPVLAMIGLVAGAAGSRVWSAAPKVDVPAPKASKLSSLCLLEQKEAERGRPTELLRILAGVAIMVAGVAIADQFRLYAQRYSGGLLRVQSLAQGEFITWQLAVFAVLLGGVVAGAGTGAGVRHGLFAGLLGGVAILGLCLKSGAPLAPVEFWLDWLSLDELPLTHLSVVVGIAGSVLLAGVVGGWLGGTLFLPLAPEHMRRRLQIGTD